MKKFRKAFSMLVAIFVIMMLSIVASYIFYASSSIAKEGPIQYQREQAMLLARSYTEYAVMAISGNDRNIQCLNSIRANIGNNPNIGQGYRVEVEITYIGNQKYLPVSCSNVAARLNNNDVDTLSVILDVYVRYKDLSNPNLYNGKQNLVPWRTYHKRSLQKI